ncbi:universal stress protein [Ningiella sp. W23]|uniref:universal stress protein n=1 Tax=Ningiella sp. W23 TaxID=3023715 RepID=UPI00375686DA
MKNYKRILVAIDIYSEYDRVLQRALSSAAKPSDCSLVFVTLPPVYFQPYITGVGGDFVVDIERQSRTRLGEIAKQHKIPEENVYVPTGRTADEIQSLADDIGADLIVIGTHGRSGLKLLLGATANELLHGVKQDVLAVRIDGAS